MDAVRTATLFRVMSADRSAAAFVSLTDSDYQLTDGEATAFVGGRYIRLTRREARNLAILVADTMRSRTIATHLPLAKLAASDTTSANSDRCGEPYPFSRRVEAIYNMCSIVCPASLSHLDAARSFDTQFT